MKPFGKGLMIAGAVAALVLSGNIQAKASDKAEGAVHCAGINSCKGHGSCAGAENACKAQNECQGKGWVEKSSAEECTEAGGTVVKS